MIFALLFRVAVAWKFRAHGGGGSRQACERIRSGSSVVRAHGAVDSIDISIAILFEGVYTRKPVVSRCADIGSGKVHGFGG